MTKEEEAAIAAEVEAQAKAEAEANANVESPEEEAEESEEESSKDLKIDYEAELAKEREAREKAERTLADKAFKEREAKRQAGDADASKDESDDKPLTARELDDILSKRLSGIQKDLEGEKIKEIAKSLASSEGEANLIVEIHKNRTFPLNLSLERQLEECYAIANRERILAQNAELKRALRSKETATGYAGEAERDSGKAGEPKLSPQDAEALKMAGMVWDGVKRVYKSPIGGKKHFYYDPKTKKRWTA